MPSIDPRIPSPPVHFLPRLDLLAKVRSQLLKGNNPVGITGRPSAVGIQGMGGIGKTVLAAALAIDDTIIRAFPGGVHWLSLGTEPTLIEGQRHLARRLGSADANFTDESGGFDIVSALLAKRSKGCLIVLDDVWELGHYEKLFKIHPPHRVLLTTRNAEILHQIGAVEQPVECLDKMSARTLLADYAERRVDLLPTPAADLIINECGYLPLALAIAGSVLRGANDDLWTDVNQALRDADHENSLEADLPGYLHGRHVFASLRIGVDRLKEDERERLLDCAIFPEDEAVPTALFKWLWAGLTPLHCANLLTRLIDRNLLRRQKQANGDFISLHDLQRDYLRHRTQRHSADNLANRHRRMAAAARTACKGDWSTLADGGYLLRRLAWHLREAGDHTEVCRLLLDPAWVNAKLHASGVGVGPLLTDAALAPDGTAVRRVYAALRLSAHILAKHPSQWASQLWGRLSAEDGGDINSFLEASKTHASRPWLRPRLPSLTRPGGSLMSTLKACDSWICAVALSADGRRGLSGSQAGTIELWDLDTGTVTETYRYSSMHTTVMALFVEQMCALMGEENDNGAHHTVKLFNLISGAVLATLPHDDRYVTAVALSADGRRALTAVVDGPIRLWDLATSTILATLDKCSSTYGTVLAFSANWCRFITDTGDNRGTLWYISDDASAASTSIDVDLCDQAALSEDGKRQLLFHNETMTIRDSGAAKTVTIHTDSSLTVDAVALSADGQRALTGTREGVLQLWNVTSDVIATEPQEDKSPVSALVSPTGHGCVYSLAAAGRVQRWDLASGTASSTGSHAFIPSGGVRTLSADGRHILTLTVRPEVTKNPKDRAKYYIDFHLESVATDTVISTETVISTDDGQPLARLIDAVALSPDMHRALTGSRDGRVRLWNVATGGIIMTLNKEHAFWVSAVTFSADGTHALSGSWDRTARLWNLNNGDVIATFTGHTANVTAVALSPDGRRALTGSQDNTLRLWDLDTARCRACFFVDSPITACTFADDGILVAGDQNGRLHFLDLIE